MKYRKKPIVIEAYQFNGEVVASKPGPVEGRPGLIRLGWFRRKMLGGYYGIKTLEGWHRVCLGDFIITGIAGEHYPCKRDIFKASYDLVEGQE